MKNRLDALQREFRFPPPLKDAIAALLEEVRVETFNEAIGIAGEHRGGMLICLELQRAKDRTCTLSRIV